MLGLRFVDAGDLYGGVRAIKEQGECVSRYLCTAVLSFVWTRPFLQDAFPTGRLSAARSTVQ